MEVAEHVFYILSFVTIWLDKAYQQTGDVREDFRESAAKPERHDFGGREVFLKEKSDLVERQE